MNKKVVIVAAVRTAIGAFNGALAGISPCQLATLVASEAITRANIDGSSVEQSIFGNVIHTEARDMYLSRVAALKAGMPVSAPALTLNRLCGSGLQAVISGSEQIMLGHCTVVLVGGVENMSRGGHMISAIRFGRKIGDKVAVDMMLGALTDPFGNGHMGITAENIAAAANIDRAKQDAFALESHKRAAIAIERGYFKEQIIPINVKRGRKKVIFNIDEHVRTTLLMQDLARLPPAFKPDGSVTAGNSSGINDGAAALILATEDYIESHNMPKLAIIRAFAVSGVAPHIMGLGPVEAVKNALTKAKLGIQDLSCIESNEAFAVQACAVADELEFPATITNPNGGAIALGHPIGASGAIILIKLIYELRRIGGRFGLATMCIGGGQGIAMVIENANIG